MKEQEFVDAINQFLRESLYSVRQLAQKSGLPPRTVLHWKRGHVRKPQQWIQILKLAKALVLQEEEANLLLQSAGHPTLDMLRTKEVTREEAELLAVWPKQKTPFQALAALPYFTGRATELSLLKKALTNGQQVAICSVRGIAGVGKTSLASHLAYELQEVFPDGVLWGQLNTMDTMAILYNFAAAFNEDVSQFTEIESRATAVRGILSKKKALIILDNAQNSSQVRPLLPPNVGGTAVIVTTREDLEVTDHMLRITVPVFSPQESLAVLRHFTSAKAYKESIRELNMIAHLLGYLPLAIAIAGALLREQFTIPQLLLQLQETRQRLNILIREDTGVRLSFELSYQKLSLEMQRFFVSLGAFKGEDFDLEAAVYVSQVPKEKAQQMLTHLIQRSLVQAARPDRYQLHSLLRDFAQEKEGDSIFSEQMVNYFSQFAATNTNDAPTILYDLSNLTAAIVEAQHRAMDKQWMKLILGLFPTMRITGRLPDLTQQLEQVVTVATHTQANQELITTLSYLGTAYRFLGKHEKVEDYHKQAIYLAKKDNATYWVAYNLMNFGSYTAQQHGDYVRAEQYLLEAIPFVKQLDNVYFQANIYSLLGNLAHEQGDFAQCEEYYQEGISIASTLTGTQADLLLALYSNLGTLYIELGRSLEAESTLKQGVELAETHKNIYQQSLIQINLGYLYSQQDKFLEAKAYAEVGLELAKQANVPANVAWALTLLAEIAMNLKELDAAYKYLVEAEKLIDQSQLRDQLNLKLQYGYLYLKKGQRQLAQEAFSMTQQEGQRINMPDIQGFAWEGLAHLAYVSGQWETAVSHARTSLHIFEQLNHIQAHKIRMFLDGITNN